MTVIYHNRRENDYSIYCNSCGSEEICDHEFGYDKSLESIDYCMECCPKCEEVVKKMMKNKETDHERKVSEYHRKTGYRI